MDLVALCGSERLPAVAPGLAPSNPGCARAGLGAATANGQIVVFGGHDGEQPLRTVEVFVPGETESDRGTWTQASPMLARRAYLSAEELDGRIYVVGGSADGRTLNTLEVFDVKEGAWNMWFQMPPMQIKRTLHASAVYLGKLLVCGGFDGTRDLTSVEAYDPESNGWQWKCEMAAGRSYLALVAAGDFLYAIGGQDRRKEEGDRAHKSVEVFNIFSEQWFPGPPLSAPRGRLALAGAVLIEDDKEYIYVCGGSDGVEALSSVERLDVEKGEWTEAPSMTEPRLGHSVVVLNNKLYAIGGFDGQETLDTFECFDPQVGAWGPVLKMGALPGDLQEVSA